MDRRIVPEAFKLTAPELEVMNDQGFLLAKRSISKNTSAAAGDQTEPATADVRRASQLTGGLYV
ncbi:MAG: hypothetical protein HC819_04410 [Cyclobacteriaceae bacterium]|nr:hypothetical protein [Cyclobacteriaceae bacterium]